MGLTWIGAIIVGASLIIGAVSQFVLKKKDNVVEQIAEKIIKNQTGVDIDLSPDDKDAKAKKGK